tara:strand:- start:16664 stop:16861 length:198 start_codon:yes stop_codon:yes gene_type:complete
MPIYAYICHHCDGTYEKLQSMKSRAPRKCPKCGEKGQQRRQIGSGIALKFKGSGFYVNDYPKDKR